MANLKKLKGASGAKRAAVLKNHANIRNRKAVDRDGIAIVLSNARIPVSVLNVADGAVNHHLDAKESINLASGPA